jgi:XTP/dITP diphosphohydrolase
MKIVFASNNTGKIHELQTLLALHHVEIIAQTTLNVKEIPETGLTFVENALIKARHASLQTGLPAIADDSGLEVAALHGAPGIYSARFAGSNATAEENISKLLSNMQSVPLDKRLARFYCVLVFLNSGYDPTPLICEGAWNGVILTAPAGKMGFGYDPIFFDPNEKCSAAELPIQKKNKISHRGQALNLLLKKLPEKTNE